MPLAPTPATSTPDAPRAAGPRRARIGSMPRHPLVAAAAAALIVLGLAGCSTKESRIDSGLAKGAEFLRQGDLDKASVELRNVLQIDPKNATAYVLAARLSEAQNEPRKAYGQYLKALELAPQLADARLGVARLMLFSGDLARAESSIRDVLAADPKHAGARTLQAALLAARGQLDEATAKARSVAAESGPAQAEASLVLAGLLQRQGKSAEALAALDTGLKAEPQHLGLLQAAAQVAADMARPVAAASAPGAAPALAPGAAPAAAPVSAAAAQAADAAAEYLRRATAASPKNAELWNNWARFHAARGEPERAEAVLRESIKARPDDARRTAALLEYLRATRPFEVVEKAYRDAIADKPREMSLRLGLADHYRAARRGAEADKELQQVIDLASDAPAVLTARVLLAEQRFRAGRTEEAATQIAAVLKDNPRDNRALMLRARARLAEGTPAAARDAVADLRTVQRDQPDSLEVVQQLAAAHRAAGEPQLARDVLGEASKRRPADASLRATYAADLADAKEFDQALSVVDAGLAADAKSTLLHELKARIQMARNDFAGATRTFESLKKQRPTESVGYLRLGQLLASRGSVDQALREYDAGAAAAPADPSTHLAAVGLLVANKRFDEAKRRVDERQKREPANSLHHHLQGDVALARGDYTAAEKAYRAAIAAAPKAPAGYLNVAKAAGARGDTAAALAVLVEGEKALPDDRTVSMARAEWLIRLQRPDEAISIYEKLNARFPDDDAVANNLAFLLTQRSDAQATQRALALASRFAQSRNPNFLDSLGYAHYRAGQYPQAVEVLERAAGLAQPSALLQLHLGKALVKSGQAERGRELIRRALATRKDLPGAEEARGLLTLG